ncbi:7622_t:CDS:1, partial [Cetraspora pellucida]
SIDASILESFKKHLGGNLLIKLDQSRSDTESTMKGYERPDLLC